MIIMLWGCNSVARYYNNVEVQTDTGNDDKEDALVMINCCSMGDAVTCRCEIGEFVEITSSSAWVELRAIKRNSLFAVEY